MSNASSDTSEPVLLRITRHKSQPPCGWTGLRFQCLVVENSTGSYGVRFGDCTDSPAASWSTRTVSGSTYRMVNEFTGQCMTLVPSGNPLASVTEMPGSVVGM